MKKFRMMLPVVAFLMAVGVAVAGEYMPPINAYYKVSGTCSTTTLPTEQGSCRIDLTNNRPVCTVDDNGTSRQAFNNNGCSVELRYIP